MAPLPKTLLWNRLDTTGTDHVVYDDRTGLYARGVVAAVDPIPLSCRYELLTDESWRAARLEVSVEGAGWLRSVRLERAAGRWRVTTAEQGDLNAALSAAGHPRVGLPGTEDVDRLTDAVDVDLGAAPLFNTLPVRRLGLTSKAPGSEHPITVAWVLVPSLEVLPAEQVYTVVGPDRVRYGDEGYTAEVTLDADGFVIRYPGVADRHEGRTP